jgi:peptidoglycan/xylan/chitin deacetylase (PgdA/CDA1 family)
MDMTNRPRTGRTGSAARAARAGAPRRRRFRALTAVIAGALALTAGVTTAAAAQTAAPAGVWASCPNGYVGLTYDDGPNPSSTTQLLSALQAGGAKATFFIWGAHAQQYPSLLQQEANAGMWIGNHTWDHPYMTQQSTPTMTSEIQQTQQVIQQTVGRTPILFRPPYGDTNATVQGVERQLGIQAEVLWSHDSQDWNGASTQQIVQTASTMTNGSIILMHDGGYQTTIQAVPQILSGLGQRGLCPGKIVPSGNGLTPTVVAP